MAWEPKRLTCARKGCPTRFDADAMESPLPRARVLAHARGPQKERLHERKTLGRTQRQLRGPR